MLCQFTVKNYKSIKDEITMNMQAAAIKEHKDKIIICEDEEAFLPIAAVYGPNGGGKSNVLEAMSVLKSKVIMPYLAVTDAKVKLNEIPIKPFKFTAEKHPTEFEVFFRTKLAEYRYVLHLLDGNIVKEVLAKHKIETRRETELFSRTEEGIELNKVFSKFKVADISPALPLLSYFAILYMDNEIINDVINWFKNGMVFRNYGNPFIELKIGVAKARENRNFVMAMLKEMDLDISDFRIEEKGDNVAELFTLHNVEDYSAELRLAEESSGTKKIFGLLPFIAESILNGTTLVIDELDAKLHPLLLKYVISMYTDLKKNKHGAQLIYTSHDLSTMNKETFRRDEIWFVAKGNRQDSQLYSLIEFKDENGKAVRSDAKFDKQYLEGNYGADPYFRKIINWENPNE